jgi:hypothetical protein
MRAVGGYGDMLEDFVEHAHQCGDRDQQRLALLHNLGKIATALSRAEIVRAPILR